MVTEMCPAESRQMSNVDRKRPLKEYAAPKMSTSGTQTEEEVKRPRPAPAEEKRPAPANNGWGELFKDRETFIEMHLC